MAGLMDYLPAYWQGSPEMSAVQDQALLELTSLRGSAQAIYSDALILGASDERTKQWEEVLEISPDGAFDERRSYVMSVLRGVGKLNEGKIKNIVNAFTGGSAIVSFANSTINVKVLPPHNGAAFRLPDIVRSLEKQKPAHLGLVVERYYSTWGDVKNDYSSWQDLASSEAAWLNVYNHIVRE